MPELIMCRGLQASGKTTYALDLVEKSQGKTKRVNKDDLRAMIDGGRHSKDREKHIVTARNVLISSYLSNGFNVVSDDTNFHPEHERTLRVLAGSFGATFTIKDFDTTVAECLKRNRLRPNPVPDKVIRATWLQFVYKKPEYLYDAPECVVCDLDGTLCDLNGRSPYDANTCGNDLVNHLVYEFIEDQANYHNRKIMFVSGRHDTYLEETSQWLMKHCAFDWELNMRRADDNRNDAIVKREIYEEHIKGHYNVHVWLDDRPRVINMVRFDLCLPVMDIGYGVEF